ncbi:MAG: ABC transporter ATP-binding protein [Thermodesulfobacteriota bacterium]|nr:ABC transporter ATP-binding protein [Thermodesulfobacteriota bacterium]
MSGNRSVLVIQGLTKYFGGLKAVDNVYMEAAECSITSLIGPNGAGKTTIFNLITGLLQPTSGKIYYKNQSILALPPTTIARIGIGRTFQEPRVFNRLSVLENILIGFPSQKGERVHHALLRTKAAFEEEKKNKEKAIEILEFVGLADRGSDLAQDLSHGQQRFLSVARVLASNPDLLLMDEPTVGLHREEIVRLIDLMIRLVKSQRRTILLVEHNMDVVMNISDEIHLLVEGHGIAHGKPEDIKANPKLVEAFLGTSLSGNRKKGEVLCT